MNPRGMCPLPGVSLGLNPLTRSHIAKTISCTPTGSFNEVLSFEFERPDLKQNAKARDATQCNAGKPQPMSHRGSTLARYNA